jgi:excisionase family DNA binding protein
MTKIIVMSPEELEELMKSTVRTVLTEFKPGSQSRPEDRLFMNCDEASNYLGISKPTLYGWVHDRKIPSMKVGKRLAFEKSIIDEWILNTRRKTIDEIETEAQNHLNLLRRRGTGR